MLVLTAILALSAAKAGTPGAPAAPSPPYTPVFVDNFDGGSTVAWDLPTGWASVNEGGEWFLRASGGAAATLLNPFVYSSYTLVPRESLSRALALYNATTWLGGIAGCVLTGYAVQSVGTQPTLLAGACLPLIAIGLLAASGSCRRPVEAPSRADKTSPVELQPAVL